MWNSNVETPKVIASIPKWVELYVAGVDGKTIAKRFNVHASTVYRRLREQGINIRSRAEVKLGKNNPMWVGDKVSYTALHAWVKRNSNKPLLCQECNITKAYDLANISQEYKRDVTDWEWLCRRCHMTKDGRIKNLKQYHD